MVLNMPLVVVYVAVEATVSELISVSLVAAGISFNINVLASRALLTGGAFLPAFLRPLLWGLCAKDAVA